MKRILSLVLILVMVLGMLAACGPAENPSAVAGSGLEDAKTYLAAMYKENDGTIARRDFTLVASVMIEGVTYPITWTTDSPDYVTISAAADNKVTIDIVEEPAEEVTFKLTGTLTDAEGNTATVTITRIIEAAKVTGIEFVAMPEAGATYKFALVQNNLGKTLYFNGQKSGNYLGTTENPFEAVDVTVEATEGGYYLTFMDGDAKKYINITTYSKDDGSLGKTQDIGDEPTCVYTWDAERKTFLAYIEALKDTFYLGTYNTYNTISTSSFSYIEDVTKIGDGQFPLGPCTVSIVPTQVANPEVGVAYKFALQQNNLGQTLYFTGVKSGNYLATSANPGEGVNIFVEATEGGYYLTFMAGETKKYINITTYTKDDGSLSKTQDIGDEPTCVYTWDAERKTFLAYIEALKDTFYLGTYNTYNTISTSSFSYIEDVTKIGDGQFPAGPYIVDGFMDMQPELEQKHEHTLAAAVKENEKAATCTENGSYDSVVYCSECKEKVSSETKTIEALGHTPGEPVQDNVQGGGCGEAGSYDSVVSCTVCGMELSREVVEIPATGDHNYLTETERVEPTCTEAGSVTMACSCGATQTTELPAAHTPGEAVKENVVPSTTTTEGSYDSVAYCTICGEEASRETVTTPVVETLQYKIYYPDGGTYVTATISGKKLAAGSEAEAAVWTVEIDENGYYIFSINGKYMTSGKTGNSISLEDTVTDCARWEVITCDAGVYLRNVGAAYNGKNNQYLEFYSGFTTYGFNESKANIYTFQLIQVV